MFRVVIGEISVWKDAQRESWVKYQYGKRFKEVSLSLSKLVARMYKYLSRCILRITWSFKACSTVAHLYIKPGIVSEDLLH